MGNDTSSLQEQINATAPSPAPPSPLEDAVVTRSPDTLQQFNWRHYCSRGCAPPDANRDECRALDALRFVRTLGLVQKRGDVDSALPLWRIVNSHNVMRRVLLMARIESAVSGPRTISTDARPISAAAAFQQRHSQGICTDPAPFSGSTGEAAQSSVPHSSHGGGQYRTQAMIKTKLHAGFGTGDVLSSAQYSPVVVDNVGSSLCRATTSFRVFCRHHNPEESTRTAAAALQKASPWSCIEFSTY